MNQPPQSHGTVVSMCLYPDGFTKLHIVRTISPRSDARRGTLSDMRQGVCESPVFFIRRDGLHEIWHLSELEAERQ